MADGRLGRKLEKKQLGLAASQLLNWIHSDEVRSGLGLKTLNWNRVAPPNVPTPASPEERGGGAQKKSLVGTFGFCVMMITADLSQQGNCHKEGVCRNPSGPVCSTFVILIPGIVKKVGHLRLKTLCTKDGWFEGYSCSFCTMITLFALPTSEV